MRNGKLEDRSLQAILTVMEFFKEDLFDMVRAQHGEEAVQIVAYYLARIKGLEAN